MAAVTGALGAAAIAVTAVQAAPATAPASAVGGSDSAALSVPAANDDALARVIALVDRGDFAAARSAIDAALADEADAGRKRDLAFERERMQRILLDFPHDEAAVRAQLQRDIPDLGDEEFAAWNVPSLLEQLDIDGERRYFARAVSNLYRVHLPARLRRARPFVQRSGPMETLQPYHQDVLRAATAGGTFVLPRRVRATHSVTVAADAVPAGERVRAWIPFPRAIAGQQRDVQLLSSSPADHQLAPEDTLQRTVYLEQPAVAGQPTRFSVSYELTIAAQRQAIDPAKAQRSADSALAPFLAERPPHMVFTKALRRFSDEVVGDATQPYEVARRLFAAVDRIPWGSAREYSTIANISDYALHAGHADCGQQTLLLMTLLRMNGIPSRWQSGMVFSADGSYDNLHDWGMLHLAPYGWVPMDVTTGLLDSDDASLRWFYLGGLDGYRIAFNDDFSTPLVPAKQHPRSETVDSQRGEVEWSGGNLYFDQWDYDFEATTL